MTQRKPLLKLGVLLLATVAGLVLLRSQVPAEPVPGREDRMVARLVCAFVQQGHLARPEINDELSKRLFKGYLKDLDPQKLYFLESDVEEFRRHEAELDDMVTQGDLSFAYRVYERFMTRVAERIKLAEQLVRDHHDFTVKEYIDADFDALAYPKNDEEVRERWRKRIKYDLLLHRVGQKPLPDLEARTKVLARYQGLQKRWKQLDSYEMLELYLSALTTSVDPHSTYMSPNTLDDFDIAMRLQLEGIGAVLRSENGETIVAEVMPGGAAAQDGRIKPNDKIIAVAQQDGNFVDVLDMKLRDVVKLIRGTRGTTVHLKIIPADKLEPVVYTLTRQKIELKDQQARAEIIEDGKRSDGRPFRIGVIDLPSFYADMGGARNGGAEARSATDDVRKILQDFNAKGVDAVMLDLRRNGGGALTEALSLTGLFIDQGPVVQVKGGQGRVQRRDDPEKGVVYSGPLVVLVSRLSASASEILAGALQDYGRALVVGDSATHGKGTVQMLIDLGSQLQANPTPKLGALKLTIQQFYRVNGDSTQSRGVAADIVVPSLTEHLGTGEKELEHALAFDRVQPVEHAQLGQVSPDVKAVLQGRSAQRVRESTDFAKLLKRMDLLKAQRAKKVIPLNEQELREQVARDDEEKNEEKNDELLRPNPTTDGVYKYRRNFLNDEMLRITEDFVQGKTHVQSR